MKFKLKNGEEVEIRETDSRVTPEKCRRYIARIVREAPEPFLLINRVPSASEERKWLGAIKDEIRKNNAVQLIAWKGNGIIGEAQGRRKPYRDSDKVEVGVSIARKYRALGLGAKLLGEMVKLAKKRLKPRAVYLTVVSGNKPAIALYRKIGFRKAAVLKDWSKVRGKYWGVVFMRSK